MKGIFDLRYLGNKESIAQKIKDIILDKVQLNDDSVIFDCFCGTGSISNIFKDMCKLKINDNLNCMSVYAYGRIVSSNCSFDKLGFNPIEYFNSSENVVEGYFYETYSPGGSERMYFSEYNAGRIDYFRQTIEEWWNNDQINEAEYCYMLSCLIESVSFVSNTAGVYGAFLKKWDERALKKIRFLDISDGRKTKHNVERFTKKIEDIIEDINCDVLYLDPPYTQNQYGTQYHLLETLILNDKPKSVSKVTGSRSTKEMRSDWSRKYKVHILLDRIIAKTKATHIFLSYNNAGDMSKEYIESILKRYGYEDSYECIKIPYKKYENWKSANTETHFEYLFYIKKKRTEEIIYESPLNYIGSKAKIIPQIRENIKKTETFIDLFGGGFNVGINSDSTVIYYNDINFIVKKLIESFKIYDTYEYITYVKRFIEKNNLEKGKKETYIAARDYYNSLPDGKKDIRMLFAIILYSFQQQIRFNNDYGFNNTVGVRWFNDCILAKLVSFSRIIKEKNIVFMSDDYIDITKKVTVNENCFIYMDPPYKLTTGSYNDGKRGFKGWNDGLEKELFAFFDKMTHKNVPCMLSYVLEHKGQKNTALEEWLKSNNYKYIPLGNIIGISGQPRKEILIINYDI